ncbi:MCE family protein [Prauserella oleivorans]|uniref:MCE family protein n=1 Tax=Prauserella oleivorans TaxID=1478153 RepID=A0ABW5WDF6_9PSEU
MVRDTSTATLAVRGIVVAVAVLLGAGALVAVGTGASFTAAPTITAVLPASAGPIRANSPVQYHGVTVGRLAAVDGDLDGATLTLRMDAELIGQVPANVEVRLLPRSLFGDQYIDLAVPAGDRPRGGLSGGVTLAADTSGRTVQLYDTYARFYDVITQLRPADLQVALTALSDTLRGRGAELGTMIDYAAALMDEAPPLLDSLGEDITTVARLSREVSGAAPDLLRSLDNAVALSRTVVSERDSLREVLAAGIEGTASAERLLVDHGERVVQLTEAARPVSEVLSRYPHIAGEALDAAGFFLDGGKRVFSSGLFKIEAGLTFDQPYPYTAEDCPRYPGLNGQNCGQAPSSRYERQFPQPLPRQARQQEPPHPEPPPTGGVTGPVGSSQEKEAMRRLGPLVPGLPGGTADEPDLLALLLGPLVRGERVVVP